ncbi:19965_t:CDS:2, partial [Entrophospora sp. SA101]
LSKMNPTNNSIEESNFPIDPVIKYTNKGSISNNFNYEVIELGYYPETFKITCGKNGYAILDEYKVKTTFGKNIITCSIYYNENDSPVFLIDWIKDDENFNVYSENSTTDASDLYFMKLGSNLQKSGILMFGLQLECLKNYREQNPLKEKCQDIRQTFESSESSALNINKDLEQASLIKTIFEANDICYELSYDKKNSNVEEAIVKSNLQKSGILMFGLQLECLKNYREQNPLKEKCQDIRQTFESSESSALNINKDLEQASLIKTIFEANDICYELSYDKKNSNVEEAIVKVMDEHNISRDSYRALAAIIHSLPHEYVIEKRRNKINQIITEKVPISTFNTSRENPVENDTSDVDNDSGNDTEEEINENIIVAEESCRNGV